MVPAAVQAQHPGWTADAWSKAATATLSGVKMGGTSASAQGSVPAPGSSVDEIVRLAAEFANKFSV